MMIITMMLLMLLFCLDWLESYLDIKCSNVMYQSMLPGISNLESNEMDIHSRKRDRIISKWNQKKKRGNASQKLLVTEMN